MLYSVTSNHIFEALEVENHDFKIIVKMIKERPIKNDLIISLALKNVELERITLNNFMPNLTSL